jgi:hypothetical protein
MPQLRDLLNSVVSARGRTRAYNGERVPAGAALLFEALDAERDPIERGMIYSLLFEELLLAGERHLTVKLSERRLEEFADSLSRTLLARALLHAGEPDAAFSAAAAAIDQATSDDEFVNYALLSAMGLAVESRERSRIDWALGELLAKFRPKANSDQKFDADWAPEARKLGANLKLVDQVIKRFSS